MAWLRSPEAARLAKAAKAEAILDFKKRFPNADMSRFKVQVDFDAKHKATGKCFSQRAQIHGRTFY